MEDTSLKGSIQYDSNNMTSGKGKTVETRKKSGVRGDGRGINVWSSGDV